MTLPWKVEVADDQVEVCLFSRDHLQVKLLSRRQARDAAVSLYDHCSIAESCHQDKVKLHRAGLFGDDLSLVEGYTLAGELFTAAMEIAKSATAEVQSLWVPDPAPHGRFIGRGTR